MKNETFINRHEKRHMHVTIVHRNYWDFQKSFDCRRLFTLIVEKNLIYYENFFIDIKYLGYLKPLNDDFRNDFSSL